MEKYKSRRIKSLIELSIYKAIQQEINAYKKQLQKSDLDKNTENYLFVEKRIQSLESSINFQLKTLANIILHAYPKFKKAMYLKLLIVFFNTEDILFKQDPEINQIIRNNLGAHKDFLPDDFCALIEELDDLFDNKDPILKMDILNKLELEWLSISIQEYKQSFIERGSI